MSVKAMGKIWELDLEHQDMLVLLALADHADHDGAHIYPSIDLIAWKTGYSGRQVSRIVNALVQKGLLQVTQPGGGRGRSTEYAIQFDQGAKKPPFQRNHDKMSPFPVNHDKMSPFPVNHDTMSSFPTNHDILSPFPEENHDILSKNHDIAMSPQPSGTVRRIQEEEKEEPPPAHAGSPPGGKRARSKKGSTPFPKEEPAQEALKATVFTPRFSAWYARRRLTYDLEEQWDAFAIDAQANGREYADWPCAFQKWLTSPYQNQGKPKNTGFKDDEGFLQPSTYERLSQ